MKPMPGIDVKILYLLSSCVFLLISSFIFISKERMVRPRFRIAG